MVRDAPEPRIGVRNVCSSTSQACTLCDKIHQNVVWGLYSTHDLVLGEGIQAKPSLEFTWVIPMTAGSIQALPHSSSSPTLLILLRLHMSFLFPPSPRYPHTAEKNYSQRGQSGKHNLREAKQCTETGNRVISIHQTNHKSQEGLNQKLRQGGRQ